MVHEAPGDLLCELLQSAQREVVLVAPFIQRPVLKRLLAEIPVSVALRCVTRWRLNELAAGVSDLGVWKEIRSRTDSVLYLRDDLHAKYYRVDDRCLFGSANLTGAGLKWSTRSNLELLAPPASCTPFIQAFETALFQECVVVDEVLYELFRDALNSLELVPPAILEDLPVGVGEPESREELALVWVPQLRHPADLFLHYSGANEEITVATREAAGRDLGQFMVLPGLGRRAFEAEIRVQFLQKPIVRTLDPFLEHPRRFGEVCNFLKHTLNLSSEELEPDRAWQTIMRWLIYFAPTRYRLAVPRHSELFMRIGAG